MGTPGESFGWNLRPPITYRANCKLLSRCTKQIFGKPKFVKADNGTEHSIIDPLDAYFRKVKYVFQISSFIQRSILLLAELNVSSFDRPF